MGTKFFYFLRLLLYFSGCGFLAVLSAVLFENPQYTFSSLNLIFSNWDIRDISQTGMLFLFFGAVPVSVSISIATRMLWGSILLISACVVIISVSLSRPDPGEAGMFIIPFFFVGMILTVVAYGVLKIQNNKIRNTIICGIPFLLLITVVLGLTSTQI